MLDRGAARVARVFATSRWNSGRKYSTWTQKVCKIMTSGLFVDALGHWFTYFWGSGTGFNAKC